MLLLAITSKFLADVDSNIFRTYVLVHLSVCILTFAFLAPVMHCLWQSNPKAKHNFHYVAMMFDKSTKDLP